MGLGNVLVVPADGQKGSSSVPRNGFSIAAWPRTISAPTSSAYFLKQNRAATAVTWTRRSLESTWRTALEV